MQHIVHTPLWWKAKLGRVVLYRAFAWNILFWIAFAYSVTMSIIFLLMPFMAWRSAATASGQVRVWGLSLGLSITFGLLALLLYRLMRRNWKLYIPIQSIPAGERFRLEVISQSVSMPTTMGGTIPGGTRCFLVLHDPDKKTPKRLLRCVSALDLSEINHALARVSAVSRTAVHSTPRPTSH